MDLKPSFQLIVRLMVLSNLYHSTSTSPQRLKYTPTHHFISNYSQYILAPASYLYVLSSITISPSLNQPLRNAVCFTAFGFSEYATTTPPISAKLKCRCSINGNINRRFLRLKEEQHLSTDLKRIVWFFTAVNTIFLDNNRCFMRNFTQVLRQAPFVINIPTKESKETIYKVHSYLGFVICRALELCVVLIIGTH